MSEIEDFFKMLKISGVKSISMTLQKNGLAQVSVTYADGKEEVKTNVPKDSTWDVVTNSVERKILQAERKKKLNKLDKSD